MKSNLNRYPLQNKFQFLPNDSIQNLKTPNETVEKVCF